MDQQHKKFLTGSLLLHTIILLFFIISFNFTSTMPVVENSKNNTDVINAMVMNQSYPLVSQPPLPKPPPVLPVIKPKFEVVVEKKIIIPDKHKQEKLRQELIEKQLLADLKKQQAQQKKQKHTIKQKSIEADFARELKNLNAKALQQQMKREQQRLASERQQTQGIVDKYKALVLQAISQQWLLPANVDKKLYAELLIRVAPGGVVLDAQLIKSSGDVTLDRSARAAVFKASPLPVPKEPDAFEAFRQFILKVKPELIFKIRS